MILPTKYFLKYSAKCDKLQVAQVWITNQTLISLAYICASTTGIKNQQSYYETGNVNMESHVLLMITKGMMVPGRWVGEGRWQVEEVEVGGRGEVAG